MNHDMERRSFLALSAAAVAASLAAAPRSAAQDAPKPATPTICIFTKCLKEFDCVAMAKACAKIGITSLDLTVRPEGHVLPEKVATDLPAAMAAMKGEGVSVEMITTNFKNGKEEFAKPVLETAAAQGIKYFRAGGHVYDFKQPMQPQWDAITEDLRSLGALAAQCNMIAGYHNHSGVGNFGAPLWDLRQSLAAVNSPNMGSNFDIGHATVEGAFGDWEITTRAMLPYIKMVAVKDVVLLQKDQECRPGWVPLGQGLVKTVEFFKIFQQANFSGPVSLHFEYPMPADTSILEEARKTAEVTREYLKSAGYGV